MENNDDGKSQGPNVLMGDDEVPLSRLDEEILMIEGEWKQSIHDLRLSMTC